MTNFNLAAWALRHKSIIYYFIAVLLASGIFSFVNLGRMEDPDFAIRTMVVGAAWPGASPEQMSEQVTDKLEEKLRDLPGIDYTKSFTDGSKTVIYVNLKEDLPSASIRPAWVEARNMITDVWSDLPSGVQGPIINDRFDDVYGNIYAITGDGFSYEEKRQYAESIKRSLQNVPDVKKIELLGVQKQTLYVQIDKDKLAAYQVSAQTILNALKQQSAMVPAGMVDTSSTNVYLRVNGLFDSPEAVREMPLHINGNTIRLGDIAEVKMDYSSPGEPSFYYNGSPGIGIAISMDAGGNNIALGKNLTARIAELQQQLPAGLTISQVSNQPQVVKDSIGEFSQSLFEAIVIVLAVSFIALGIRSGIVVALTIPVVVATTFVSMYATGIDLQKVSLGALIISLGLLVDDAIIVVEMMTLKLEEGMEHVEAATFAYKATAFPMLSGTLITCSGFLPIAISKGMVAEFTASLFIVVAIALLLSWLASVLVSPVLGYNLISVSPHETDSKKSRLKDALYSRFNKWLNWSLNHHKTVLLATVGMLIVSLLSAPLIKKEFFPASTRPELIVSLQFPQSSSLQYTKEQAAKMSDILSGDKRIDSYSYYVGEGAPRFILPFEPELSRNNYTQFIIVANSLEDRNKLYTDLNQVLDTDFPSALVSLQSLQIGPPSRYPIMLRVSGPDVKTLAEIAGKVRTEMKNTPDVYNVYFDWPESEPVAQIHIDPVKARMLGVDSYAVAIDLQGKISGMKVGEYYENTQTIPITFKLSGNEQHNLAALANIPIQTSSGAYVPLSQIATISMGQEEGIVWRRNMTPTITVSGTVPPTVLANSTAEDIYNNLKPLRDQLPPGYSISLDGAAEKSVTALTNLMVPIPIMIFFIMTILMFQLKKIPLMIMAMLTAPLGLIGIVLTMVITRTPMGFISVLGIIALSGMIIRNSIILLDQIEVHRAEGQEPREAIINSALMRFRPIMLTSLAAILGMIPLMRSAFWSPMAIAFSGGLLVATVLTLIVLPVMYATWYKIK